MYLSFLLVEKNQTTFSIVTEITNVHMYTYALHSSTKNLNWFIIIVNGMSLGEENRGY